MEALRIGTEYSGRIDLILTDAVMPGISGSTLVSRLETLRPGIKALYVSGYTDNSIVHHGILDSHVNFLQKPFTVEGLVRKVREVLVQSEREAGRSCRLRCSNHGFSGNLSKDRILSDFAPKGSGANHRREAWTEPKRDRAGSPRSRRDVTRRVPPKKRLTEAFKLLGADRFVPYGPWENTRSRTRTIIPRTSVRHSVRRFWRIRPSFSAPCPLVDLTSAGLAFLADVVLMPGKQVSLLLKFQEKEEELRLLGKVVYAVATGIAGYSWRIGIQFLQFAERRGCNSPKVLEALVHFESK